MHHLCIKFKRTKKNLCVYIYILHSNSSIRTNLVPKDGAISVVSKKAERGRRVEGRKKERKKKTKKAASQAKQINSSVGWSRVFSGLAPNICFARPRRFQRGIYTQKRGPEAYPRRNPERTSYETSSS